MKKIIFTIAIALIGFASQAQETKAAQQEKAIEEGVQNEQLNEKQAAKLEKRKDRIAKDEAKAKENGKVTKVEAAELNARDKKLDKDIKRKKKNRVKETNP